MDHHNQNHSRKYIPTNICHRECIFRKCKSFCNKQSNLNSFKRVFYTEVDTFFSQRAVFSYPASWAFAFVSTKILRIADSSISARIFWFAVIVFCKNRVVDLLFLFWSKNLQNLTNCLIFQKSTEGIGGYSYKLEVGRSRHQTTEFQ